MQIIPRHVHHVELGMTTHVQEQLKNSKQKEIHHRICRKEKNEIKEEVLGIKYLTNKEA